MASLIRTRLPTLFTVLSHQKRAFCKPQTPPKKKTLEDFLQNAPPLNLATESFESSKIVPRCLSTPRTKVTELPNGLKVATEEGYGENATVGVWINAGSAYETAENNGTAHFLEHMAFKGTNTRTREQIELEVENMGTSLNAYTSREQTVYYARCFRKNVGKTVDIITDILQNSKLEPDAIEQERSTILREMEEVEKNIEEVVFDQLHAVAYQNDPLGFTILGPRANIKSIQKSHLQDYIKTHYTPNRMVLVGSGAVSHDELVEAAQRTFGTLPAKHNPPAMAPPDFVGSMVSINDQAMPLVHCAIAAESVGWTHPAFFTFQVLQAIIGRWDRAGGAGPNISSKLAETLSQYQLAHSMSAFNTFYHNTGLFGVYASMPAEHGWECVARLVSEWVRISRSVTDTEVERAKNKVKASVLMSLDSNYAIAEDIGKQMLNMPKGRMSASEMFALIDAIDVDAVKAVARDYLVDVDVAVSAIGPFQEFPDYNHIRGFTYWNRL